jgi:hypothetical protein
MGDRSLTLVRWGRRVHSLTQKRMERRIDRRMTGGWTGDRQEEEQEEQGTAGRTTEDE